MGDPGRRGPVDTRLLRIVPALRAHLAVAALVAAATAVAVIAQAELLADGLAQLVSSGDITGGTTSLLIGLVAIASIRAAGGAIVEWSAGRTMRAARSGVRAAVLDHALLDTDRTATDLATREATVATSGVDQLEPYIRQFLPSLMLAVTVPITAGARILFADWLSAVLIAVTVPLIPVFMVLIGLMTERRTQRQWAVLQRLSGHFLDVLSGLPTLRLFGRADAQARSVRDVSEQYRTATMGALRVAFLSALALELLATLSVALIAVEVGLRLAGGGLDLTTALVILLLAPECYLPLRRVGASFHAAQSGLDAADDLVDVLDRPTLAAGTRSCPSATALRLRSVGIRRGGHTVVSDLDVDVSAGELVVLTGPSGVGKSSVLAAVRGRLPWVGHVEAGGSAVGSGDHAGFVDVATIDPDAWADRLAVVPQTNAPITANVGDEVRASTDAPADVIEQALGDVGLRELLTRRPDELSGGQLRRVQVARAAVAVRRGRANVVIADEPTAHLDPESARSVWAVLRGLADAGAGVLVASHDPLGADTADRVVALPADPTTTAGTATGAHGEEGEPAGWSADVSVELTTPISPHVDASTLAMPAAAPEDRSATDRDGARPLRRVLAMAAPVRRRFVGAAALGALAEICTLGLAGAAAWLIVRAGEQPDLADLALAVVAVRAFGIGKGVFRYGERLATHDAGLRSLSEIRAAVIARLARVAPSGVPGWERGDLLQRVVDDVDRLLDLFVRVLGPMLSVGLAVLATAVITVALEPAAAVVLVAAVVVVGLVLPAITIATERSIAPRLAQARADLANEMLRTTEQLDHLHAQRLFRRRRDAIGETGATLDHLDVLRTRRRIVTTAVTTAAPLLTTVATIALLAPTATSISGPVLGVLVLWPLTVIELVGTVEESAATVPDITAAAARIVEAIDVPEPIPPRIPSVSLGIAAGDVPRIELHQLSARWPGAAVDSLGPVHLAAAPGTRVSVSGPSGSGKSTLAAVLVRFCPAAAGRYEVAGRNVVDIDAAELRTHVTWIQQVPWLADSSVRENLRIADHDADDDRLLAAVRDVRLGPWLDRHASGLDTMVGRSGAALSGGEAQRLALARALLAGHGVVILDEPTAHLDAATAHEVMATVRTGLGGRTTIVMGHVTETPSSSPQPRDPAPAGATR